MEARDIIHANRIGNLEGKDAKVAEFVRLFNEKYAEPQVIMHVELSPSEQRFFQLHNERKICPLPPEDEEEYQRLLDEWSQVILAFFIIMGYTYNYYWQMNKERKQRFQNVVSSLEEAKDELTDIQAEELDALDALPEGLQMSSRGDKMQEWIDFIDDTISSIDAVIMDIETQTTQK